MPAQATPKTKGQSRYGLAFCFNSGAGERNRTLDLLITSELLYQLSYTGATRILDHVRAKLHTAGTKADRPWRGLT